MTKTLQDFPIVRFRRALLRWYARNQRRLPWRGQRDPCRVWISEIMLQQTRVAVVAKRYPEFVRRFPNVRRLARAPLSEVLALWSGLGYYRRARMLHEAARWIARNGGNLPGSASELRELPGIGRYTAAAIASIAFGEPVAVVDGNVERVLTRLLNLRDPSVAQYWDLAQALLDCKCPGDFNQAMMELGATVCLPRQPLCEHCPLVGFCKFRRGERTRKKARISRRQRVRQNYVIWWRRDSVFLARRPERGALMAGMWELPRSRAGAGAIHVRHSITTTDFEVFATVRPGVARSKRKGRWMPMSRLGALPLTGLTRKLLRAAFPALTHHLK